MYISYIVLCDMYMWYVYVQTLIMLLRLGMHTKDINKNKTKQNKNKNMSRNIHERVGVICDTIVQVIRTYISCYFAQKLGVWDVYITI